MKVALLLLLVAAIATIGVQSTSLPICTNVNCADQHCDPVSCTCGSYKGSCGCCDVCKQCANSTCITLRQDVCEDFYWCKLNDPNADIFKGAEGTCVPYETTADRHGHAQH